jgi:DNA-binding transcriptional ArsR family regulator
MAHKAPLPIDDYVFETLLSDLVGHDRAASAFILFLKLWHACGGPGRRGVALSLSTLASETGLSKSSVQTALRRLKRRGLVKAERAGPTAIPVYTVTAPWRR